MNAYEELKAWADKWGINYTEHKADEKWPCNQIYFDSCTYSEATFSQNALTGEICWYGGD